MKVILTEKIFLTTNEISIINQFIALIGDINRIAESRDLHKMCDNVLDEIASLTPYILPE